MLRLGTASLVGGLVGAVLLLVLPLGAFDAIVPVLIVLGVCWSSLGPRISRRVRGARRADAAPAHGSARGGCGPRWRLTGVYGGYFGAAQGVLLMAILGIGVDDTVQRHNGVKNALRCGGQRHRRRDLPLVVAHVDWSVVRLIAVGSIIGGQIGAKFGRRLPPRSCAA